MAFHSIESNWTYTTIHLGTIHFTRELKMQAANVELANNVYDPSIYTTNKGKDYSKIEVFSDYFTARDGAKIAAGRVLLFANKTLELYNGTKIMSAASHSCNEDPESTRDLFTCLSDDARDLQFDYEDLVTNYNEQYGLPVDNNSIFRASRTNEITNEILGEWYIYVMGIEETYIHNSQIIAPRIGVCSNYV